MEYDGKKKTALHDAAQEEQTLLDLTREVMGIELAAAQTPSQRAQSIRKYYESIIACMPGVVYWVDKNLITLGCNDNELKVLGLTSRSQFVGLTCEQAAELGGWKDNQIEKFKTDFQYVIETGEPKLAVEEPPLPGGPEGDIYYLTNRVPLRDDNGDVIGALGVSIDISERRRAEEALKKAKQEAEEARERAEEASRAKSEFLAVMSHEFRTPLNAIIGVANNISKTPQLSEEQRKSYLPLLKHSCDEMLSLITDILEFSRTEGHLKLQEELVDLEALLHEIKGKFSFKASDKGLSIIVHIPPGCPVKVISDTQRLRQIISNLLDNGLKYSRVGQVTLSLDNKLSKDGRYVDTKIIVADTGIGIPKDQQEMVFEKFTQLETSNSKRYAREHGGVGLGLSIVKRFVTVLKGTIGLESQVGVGSKFTCQFNFPAPVAEYRIAEHMSAIKGVRILLVDENVERCEQWRQMLMAWGFRAISASVKNAISVMFNSFDSGEYFPIVMVSAGKDLGKLYDITHEIKGNPRFGDTLHMAIFADKLQGDKVFLEQQGYDLVIDRCQKPDIFFEPLLKKWEKLLEEKEKIKRSTLASKTVLIVEDNPINQQILKMMMRSLECSFDIASSGAMALEKLRTNKYDTVLMDVGLTDMNGLDVTQELRKFEKDGYTPVVALTAHAFEEDRNRCFQSGMDDYLTKPLDEEKLLLTVKRWVTRGRNFLKKE